MNQEPSFKEFVPAAVKTITEQGGKFLTCGGRVVNIEGPAPVSAEDKRLTLVEFENMEDAQRLLHPLTTLLEQSGIKAGGGSDTTQKAQRFCIP